MKIAVSRAFPIGYTFVVEREKDYDTVDEIIEACLKLENALIVKPTEEDQEDR